jgi:hypothetical protein
MSSKTKSVSITSTTPSVRSACKACHERKIRCITPPTGGPCHICQSTGRSCYFLPRYKSGRPRRESSSISSHSITPPATETIIDVGKATTPTREWESPAPDVLLAGTLSTSTADSFAMPGAAFDFSDLDVGTFPTLVFGGFSDPAPGKSSESALQYLGLPMSNWPPASSHQRHDDSGPGPAGEPGGVERFSSLLKHCAKLNRHLERTPDVNSQAAESGDGSNPTRTTITHKQFQEMVQDIDATCNAIFSIYGGSTIPTQPDSGSDIDSASASLTMAIIFKIFEVCEALFDGKVLNNHSLNNVLLHKRLDFNMTQARIVMSHIEQLTQSGLLMPQETIRKAAYIEKRFRSIGNADVMETTW